MTESRQAPVADFDRFIDKPVGPYYGWDAINRAMIRHWCDAMGDANPIYTDPEAARANGHDGIVAPPPMLQAWAMRGFGGHWAPGSAEQEPFAVLEVLEDAGYPAVVAVNCEQEYLRYLQEGDEVHFRSRIESISEEKTTALGVGFFVTELSEYFNQQDQKVALMRFRVFKYRPHQQQSATDRTAPEKPAAPKRMRPVRNYDTAFFWEGADDGRLLIQHCKTCDTLRHPPAPMCPHCQSLDWDAVAASGRGTVYSFVIMHYPPIPPFDYPNPIALVELEEGTRLVTQLVDVKPKDIEVGMAVEVVFSEVEDGLVLPQFRPTGGR